jgi:dihydroorotate dehydrogenase (fumarate)
MDSQIPVLEIHPPILNSANPWATTLEDLEALFASPHTGAVTTRTSLLKGFNHDPTIHQYTFFDPVTHVAGPNSSTAGGSSDIASLNTLGYSPIPLSEYLSFIKKLSEGLSSPTTKPIIVSVTGTPEEVAECYRLVAEHSKAVKMPLAIEINLSCPNIPNAPPPAYSGESLSRYLNVLEGVISSNKGLLPRVPYGLKTPPYTHAGQFETLVSALRTAGSPCPVSFLSATNTLGSCLVLSDGDCQTGEPKLAGLGVGGMAGAPLHPLALGNVATLRRLLDKAEETTNVKIIGSGGVEDASGYRRMRGVGAVAVGVGTALGRKGVSVFKNIDAELGGSW